MPHEQILDRMFKLLDQLNGLDLPEQCDPIIQEVRDKLEILRGYSHG